MMSSHRLLDVVLFLLLLFSSIQFSQSTEAPPPSIDLKNTMPGYEYYIRESCRSNPGGASNKLKRKDFDVTNGKCDVVIRTRRRGVKKLLVEIDIEHIPSITGPTKLDPTKSITISQGVLKIECKPDGIVEIECTSTCPSISIASSRIVSFTDKRLYCSFTMESPTKKLGESGLPSGPISLNFFHDANGLLTYEDGGFWTLGALRCDPDLVDTFGEEWKDISYTEPEEKEVDKEWTCSSNRILYAQIENTPTTKLVERVECEESQGIWKVADKLTENPFRVTCGLRFCSQCNQETLSEFKCPSCSKATVDQAVDKCSEITCTTNRWFLDEKWMENPNMKCVKNEDNTFGWQANGKKVEKGACTSKYDCLVHSDVKLDCDARKRLCQDPILSANRMNIACDNANSFHLGYGDGPLYKDIELICDDTRGVFKNGEDDVPSNISIGCYKEKASSPLPSSSQPSTGSLPLQSWLPIAIIATLLCIGGALLFFFMKRRQSMEDAEEEPTIEEVDQMMEAEEMNPNRGAAKREKNRIRLTKADNEILQEKRKRRSRSSHSSRDSRSSSNSSIASNKSTKSVKSRKTGQVKILPNNHFKRDLNPDLRAPNVEPYVVTKENMVPGPRNISNCPDSYSTSMDFQNPRLRERAKTMSTSVIPQSGASNASKSTPSIPSAEKKKTE